MHVLVLVIATWCAASVVTATGLCTLICAGKRAARRAQPAG